MLSWTVFSKTIASFRIECIHGTRDHRSSDAIVKVDTNDDCVYAVFHIRVGDDYILDASISYWENLFRTLRTIVDFEFGSEKHIRIYFSFFQAQHRKRSGKRLRDSLLNLSKRSPGTITNQIYQVLMSFWTMYVTL
jgi:hypothetical protein